MFYYTNWHLYIAKSPKWNPQCAQGLSVLQSTPIRNPPPKNRQHRLWHSNLELPGPRSDLKVGPRSYRGVRSAEIIVEIPHLPPKR
eukprot:564685-Alexandrium_andersonii.AAC.1